MYMKQLVYKLNIFNLINNKNFVDKMNLNKEKEYFKDIYKLDFKYLYQILNFQLRIFLIIKVILNS